MAPRDRLPSAGAGPPRDAGTERFDLLYREYAPGLRRRLRARFGSSEEANDLVQDAFARMLGARATDGLREPAAFLNRIVRNLLIDHSRRLFTRASHVPLDIEIAIPPDQGEQIELEQMRERYRDAVALLPPRMQEVFVLHRIEGLTYKQVAARLDISVRTVEWHIAEAIVRISRGLDFE
jgi:RNA polymerase sigma-70 factor (ECF subfamily)